jgi:MtaA/CmuA family methyltransferase
LVGCFDQYPFSLACALMGIDRLMMTMVDDPALVDALLDRCVDHVVAYGEALAAAGADMLSGGDSPAGLAGPRFYRELALPHERQVIQRLRQSSGKPVSLHICGDATGILPDMAASGADVLELDQRTDAATAMRVIGPDIALWGNLDPVGLLAQGTPGQVAEKSRELLQVAAEQGHRRFVLSSGCTLAMETPAENLDALIDAV